MKIRRNRYLNNTRWCYGCNKYLPQLDYIDKDYTPVHVAIIIEAIFIHFVQTGIRLCNDWYVRTSNLDSVGDHVCVGNFDGGGLCVSDSWDDSRNDSIGLLAAKKLSSNSRNLDTPESLNLEALSKRLALVETRLDKYNLK